MSWLQVPLDFWVHVAFTFTPGNGYIRQPGICQSINTTSQTLKMGAAITQQECEELCSQDAKCLAFTYATTMGATDCNLLFSSGQYTNVTGVPSNHNCPGLLAARPTPQYQYTELDAYRRCAAGFDKITADDNCKSKQKQCKTAQNASGTGWIPQGTKCVQRCAFGGLDLGRNPQTGRCNCELPMPDCYAASNECRGGQCVDCGVSHICSIKKPGIIN